MTIIKISEINGKESFLKNNVQGKIVEKLINNKKEKSFIIIQDDFSSKFSIRKSRIVIEFHEEWYQLVHQKINKIVS